MGTPHRDNTTPFACFQCRKSFKRNQELRVFDRPCPSCGGVAHRLFQKFQAPRSSSVKKWKLVEFLYNHGFWFQSVYDQSKGGLGVSYPRSLEAAKSFVREFKDQAVTRDDITW